MSVELADNQRDEAVEIGLHGQGRSINTLRGRPPTPVFARAPPLALPTAGRRGEQGRLAPGPEA